METQTHGPAHTLGKTEQQQTHSDRDPSPPSFQMERHQAERRRGGDHPGNVSGPLPPAIGNAHHEGLPLTRGRREVLPLEAGARLKDANSGQRSRCGPLCLLGL